MWVGYLVQGFGGISFLLHKDHIRSGRRLQFGEWDCSRACAHSGIELIRGSEGDISGPEAGRAWLEADFGQGRDEGPSRQDVEVMMIAFIITLGEIM